MGSPTSISININGNHRNPSEITRKSSDIGADAEHIQAINNINIKKLKEEARQDFIIIIKPALYFYALFLVRKYNLKENVFTRTSNWGSCFCVIPIAGLVYMCLETFNEFTVIFKTPEILIMYMIIYLQYIVQFAFICVAQFTLRKYNLEFITTLQELYSYLYRKCDVTRLRFQLLVPCALYLSVYTTLLALKLSLDPMWSWRRGLFICATFIFDFDMIYASFILHLSSYILRRWSDMVNTIGYEDKLLSRNIFIIFNKFIETVCLLQRILQISVLYNLITGFTQTLAYIQILITWAKYQISGTGIQNVPDVVLVSHALGVALWLLKGFLLQSALCYCGEALCRQVDAAKHTAILKLREPNSGETRRWLKNTLRLCSVRFGALSACGLWAVRARLPLLVANVAATYTIVLLQFAFL